MRAIDAQKNVEYLRMVSGEKAKGTMEKIEKKAETTIIDPIFLKAYGVQFHATRRVELSNDMAGELDEEFSEYLDHLVEIENKRKADEEEEK